MNDADSRQLLTVNHSLSCPLCAAVESEWFHRDRRRAYRKCGMCELVFVPARFFLSAEAEKACYDQHQNYPDDPGYRRFLGRLFQPLTERLRLGDSGLDFGSGPGPTLSGMLTEAGFPTTIYDPFYALVEHIWQDRYDFVTASEVVEHLHRPREELQRLWTVLRPGGWLGIMTKRVLNQAAFATWHYKNDPTHVIFFSKATFVWLARRWAADLEIAGPDVVLLRKPVALPSRENSIPPPSADLPASSNILATTGPRHVISTTSTSIPTSAAFPKWPGEKTIEPYER